MKICIKLADKINDILTFRLYKSNIGLNLVYVMKNILMLVVTSVCFTLFNNCNANTINNNIISYTDNIKQSLDSLQNICNQTIMPSFDVKKESALLGSMSIDLGYEKDTHLLPEAIKMGNNLSQISSIIFNMKKECDTILLLKNNINRNMHYLKNSVIPDPKYQKLHNTIDNLQNITNQI